MFRFEIAADTNESLIPVIFVEIAAATRDSIIPLSFVAIAAATSESLITESWRAAFGSLVSLVLADTAC